MAFEVILTQKAQVDIDEYARYIAIDSTARAARWKTELESLILSLDEMPSRFSVISEADQIKLPYRSAIHHSHRGIFRIDEKAGASTLYVSTTGPECR